MAVGYKKDENFKPVKHKAMELCSLNRQDVNYHFPLMQQMIEIGKGGAQPTNPVGEVLAH